MSDLAPTAANVMQVSGPPPGVAVAGVDLVGGQMIYLDKTDSSKAKLADCDASAATKEAVGMVICASAKAGQHVTYAKPGAVVAMGNILTAGSFYALSDVAGAVRPVADNGSGDGAVLVGAAISGTQMKLHLWNSGATV